MMFKYETSKFSKHLLYMSIDLNAGKVERMVQQNLYHICAYYYCFSSELVCNQKPIMDPSWAPNVTP